MPLRYSGELALFNRDESIFTIIKVRRVWHCLKCGGKISKGCYCMGSDCWKICLSCSKEFIGNFKNSMEGYKDIVDRLDKNLRDMEEEVKVNNFINAL